MLVIQGFIRNSRFLAVTISEKGYTRSGALPLNLSIKAFYLQHIQRQAATKFKLGCSCLQRWSRLSSLVVSSMGNMVSTTLICLLCLCVCVYIAAPFHRGKSLQRKSMFWSKDTDVRSTVWYKAVSSGMLSCRFIDLGCINPIRYVCK